MGEPNVISNTCPDCNGSGYQGTELCGTCMGTGAVPVRGIALYLKTKFEAETAKWNALEAWCTSVNQKLVYLKDKIDAL